MKWLAVAGLLMLERLSRPRDNMRLYHAGRELEGGAFDPDKWLKSGEGNSASGPGVYFSPSMQIALGYTQYLSDPWMYEVEVPNDELLKFAGPIGWATPATLRALYALEAEASGLSVAPSDEFPDVIEGLKSLPEAQRLPAGRPFEHGAGVPGVLVRRYGHKAAREKLVEAGIRGTVLPLPHSPGASPLDQVAEVCVFDPSVVTIKDSLPAGAFAASRLTPNEWEGWWRVDRRFRRRSV